MTQDKSHRNWNKAKEQASSLIVAFSESLTDEPVYGGETLPTFISGEGLGSLYLTKEEALQLRQCCNAYLALTNRHNISERTVKELLNQALLSALDVVGQQPDTPLAMRIEQALEQLHKQLHAQLQPHITYWRISGAQALGSPLEFGSLKFVTLGDDEFREYENAVRAGNLSDRDKEVRLQLLAEDVVAPLAGKTVAIVEANALDSWAAMDQAIEKVRFTLDIINFLVSTKSADSFSFVRLYEGDTLTMARVPIYAPGPEPTMHYHYTRNPGSIDVALQDILGDPNDQLRQSAISVWLKDSGRSDFADALLTAMKWAGRAAGTPFAHEAFLQYTIALESVVMDKSMTQELSYRLRLYIAHLIGVDQPHKRKVFDAVNKLYQVRSQIVHNGQYELTNTDLRTLRYITHECILHLLLNEPFRNMRSRTELADWFKTQVLR